MTIRELQSRYAAGFTPSRLIGEIYQKISAWNDPAIFLHLPPLEELLEIAGRVDALPRDLPLWGIPFVVKDNIDVADWPTTAACPEYSRIPAEDAETVRLLRAAGAIPIAKANLDQFATGLVGSRSPHGVPRNAIAPDYLPGGSSSGSASSVAAGLCVFSLGTDTAGSGRVPAAFQELIGWKPTRGLLSNRGTVPACRSLDCISVFTNCVADAFTVSQVVGKHDPLDIYSRPVTPAGKTAGKTFRFGLPSPLDFSDDPDTPELFAKAVEHLESIGGIPVEIDLTPFTESAKLLYEGPWVAERWAAVGDFVGEHPDAVFPVTRKILEDSRGWDAVSAFKAQYKLREFALQAEPVWKDIDVLFLPTTPRLYTVEENLAEPFGTNATLGRYTNFMNLLDLSAVAVPAGRARGGTAPWGVTLAAPAGHDFFLLDLAARFSSEVIAFPPTVEERIPLLVCGAHLQGLPLHWQLSDRGAILREETRTAAVYRMFAMPATGNLPPRPALVHDVQGGSSIAVEVWELTPADFGDFVAKIPSPLGIGKVLLEDGTEVPGFIAEPRAIPGAEEITSHGGWKAWLSSRA